MAARVDLPFVIDKMTEKDLPFFTLTAGRDKIEENQSEGNVEKAIELLQDTLDVVQDDFVVIKIANKTRAQIAKGGSNHIQFEYKIQLKAPRSRNAGVFGLEGGGDNILMQLFSKITDLNVKLVEEQGKNARFELEERLKRLEEGSPLEKFIPVIQGFLNKTEATSPGVGMAGDPKESVKEKSANEAERTTKVREALKKLWAIDPDLPENLAMIADYATANPMEYKMFIAGLKEEMKKKKKK